MLADHPDINEITALRFQVDNVARYVQEVWSDKTIHLADHIPNIAPLAPNMWFEWGNARHGCLVKTVYDRDRKIGTEEYHLADSEVRWVLRIAFLQAGSAGLQVASWITFIKVKEDGRPSGSVRLPSPLEKEIHAFPGVEYNTLDGEELTVLTAICFAHCKGVTIEEHQPSRQVRRAAEREKKPVFNFYTIDIRPATTVLRTEGHISENGLARALHICRGHFAHYTAEKPLFGKYTGTFYRPMHIRGNAEQGAVIKDYRVHPKEPS